MRIIELIDQEIVRAKHDKDNIIEYWFSTGEKDASSKMAPQMPGIEWYMIGYEDYMYRQEIYQVRRLIYFYVILPARKLSRV